MNNNTFLHVFTLDTGKCTYNASMSTPLTRKGSHAKNKASDGQ